MRASRGLVFVLFSMSCTRPLYTPNGVEGDGGLPGACDAHHDIVSCTADPACRTLACPDACGTGPNFLGCVEKGAPVTPISCPLAGTCSTCHGLDASACAAAAAQGRCQVQDGCCGKQFNACLDPGEPATECAGALCPPVDCVGLDQQACEQAAPTCRVNGCTSCNGPAYAGCSPASAPPLECPAPAPCSTPPPSCDQLTNAMACEARSDCHAVFEDAGTCDCAQPGCCTTFNHCAAGKANCAGPASCSVAPPPCSGAFAVSFAAGCYEGCVLKSECQ
jgi:hypothetical protein